MNKQELHNIIRTHLQPYFNYDEEAGMFPLTFRCPICKRMTLASEEEDFYTGKKHYKACDSIKHKPNCYWRKVKSND